jgi:signal transduction histidine kinase
MKEIPASVQAHGWAIVFAMAWMLSSVASNAADSAAPKRVLIVHSFARDAATFGPIAATFRAELTKRIAAAVIFDEIDLDADRSGSDGGAAPVIAFLNARFAHQPPDVIVAVGAPAAQFSSLHRGELFPSVPRLMAGEERTLRSLTVGPDDAIVAPQLSLHDTIDGILRVRPDTQRVAIILGASTLDQFWASALRRELASYADRLQVVWLDGLPFDDLLDAARGLPAHSAILYSSLTVDGRGVVFERENALAALRNVTAAPIFGFLEDELGQGLVGGVLVSESRTAAVLADIALRVLSGDGMYERAVVVPSTPPTYDWRELQHWGIDESLLPADAVVRFRPPSLWNAYRNTVLAIAAVIAVQSVLIVLLLIQRLRRRRAEAEVLRMSAQLISAHEDERRRLAGELHDDFSQRLARLAIDASQVESHADANGATTARSLRNELIRISEDVHDLSYRLHPSIIDDLGLIAALRAECSRTARDSDLHVDVHIGAVPEHIAPNVALCVFRVVQEALRNVVRHAHANTVDVSLDCVDDALQLVARDDGQGLAQEKRNGLGLASMRERVRQLGGRLSVDSEPGRGTRVTAMIPLTATAR